jgi:nucleoside-diphosphate-sugar epimerase
LTYDTTDNEKELVVPAIKGVKAILSAAAKTGKVKRVVLTSSFASVIDVGKNVGPGFKYRASDWNPLSYDEACAPETSAVVAYRGSKKFAELEAWNFIEQEKPSFDLVTFCPPMTFGPVVHDVRNADELNESNANLWKVAVGGSLPEARVPVWVDVRDLSQAHVEALLSEKTGGKRYTIAASDKFSYELAASILRKHFKSAKDQVVDIDDAAAPESYDLDNETVSKDLGVQFRSFESSVIDLFEQLERQGISPWK